MDIRGRSGTATGNMRDVAACAAGSRGGRSRWLLALGTGLGLGAAATYLLDPERGRTRRARFGERAAAAARRITHRAGQLGRLQRGRLTGLGEQLRRRGGPAPTLNDASLTKKVETALFRDPAVPKGTINVNVEQGVAVLRGEVGDQTLRQRLEVLAGRVAGVEGVRNLLHLPAEPAATAR